MSEKKALGGTAGGDGITRRGRVDGPKLVWIMICQGKSVREKNPVNETLLPAEAILEWSLWHVEKGQGGDQRFCKKKPPRQEECLLKEKKKRAETGKR